MTEGINELRAHLFATLAQLRDKEAPMEIDRARVISQVAGTLIDSARLEIEHMKVTGEHTGTGFLPLPAPDESEHATPTGVVRTVTHRIRG